MTRISAVNLETDYAQRKGFRNKQFTISNVTENQQHIRSQVSIDLLTRMDPGPSKQYLSSRLLVRTVIKI